jgi:hypothetical protein
MFTSSKSEKKPNIKTQFTKLQEQKKNQSSL